MYVESLCRICLGEGASIPIFDDCKSEDGLNSTIHSKLSLCLNDKFEDVDGYPRYICDCCQETLNTIIDFINKYKETCSKLQERLKVCSPNKNNPTLDVVVKQENIDNEDYEDIVYLDDNSFEGFESKPIKKDIRIDFEDGAHFKEKIKPMCKLKTREKNKIKKGSSKVMNTYKKCEMSKCKSIRKTSSRNENDWRPVGPSNKVTAKEFVNKKSLAQNKKKQRPTVERKPQDHVLCKSCGEAFRSCEKLELHEKRKHTKHICPTCNVSLSSLSHLDRHVKRKHSDVKDFICDECGKGFAFQGDLTTHLQGVHAKIRRKQVHKKLPCKLCKKTFVTKTILLIHERSAHTGERPAVCTVCNASFFHEDYLKEHMRLHTGERPFECPVCGRGYAQRGNMKSHMRNHRISQLDQATLDKIKPSWYKFMKP